MSRVPDDWRVPATILLAFVVFCLWKRLPTPDVDDLFFLGAPLHMVKTGELANPLLSRWAAGFGTDKYYLQMPLHPHLVAGWLLVFGVSAPAVLGFVWTCYGVGALGLWHWLRRFGWTPAQVLWLLPIYLTLMLWLCQRPDMTAFALLFAGLGVLDPRRAGAFWRGTAGFALLGASVLCYPTAAIWAVALVLAEALHAAGEERVPLAAILRRWLPALGVAVVIVSALFVGLVRGDVREFLRVFQAHRALRSASFLTNLTRGNGTGNKAWLALPIFVLYPALALWAAWPRRLPGRVRALVLGTFAAAVAGVVVYNAFNARVGFLLGFFISGLAVAGAWSAGRWRAGALLTLYGLLGTVGAVWFAQAVLGRAPGPRDLAAARARWDAEAPGRTLFVDAAAARYLFDYRLPPGALDLFYGVPPPRSIVPYVPGEREVLWAAAHPWLRYVEGAPSALQDYPKHVLLGRTLDTFPQDPFEIVVLGDR